MGGGEGEAPLGPPPGPLRPGFGGFFHKDEDSEEYSGTYFDTFNQALLTQKYQVSPPITFYCLEAYDTCLAVACLKISLFFN